MQITGTKNSLLHAQARAYLHSTDSSIKVDVKVFGYRKRVFVLQLRVVYVDEPV